MKEQSPHTEEGLGLGGKVGRHGEGGEKGNCGCYVKWKEIFKIKI